MTLYNRPGLSKLVVVDSLRPLRGLYCTRSLTPSECRHRGRPQWVKERSDVATQHPTFSSFLSATASASAQALYNWPTFCYFIFIFLPPAINQSFIHLFTVTVVRFIVSFHNLLPSNSCSAIDFDVLCIFFTSLSS